MQPGGTTPQARVLEMQQLIHLRGDVCALYAAQRWHGN